MKKVVTDIVHVMLGFACGFSLLFFPLVSIMVYMQFVIYEILEWEMIHDKVYNDLKEFGIGFAIGLIVSILMSILAPQISFFFRTL